LRIPSLLFCLFFVTTSLKALNNDSTPCCNCTPICCLDSCTPYDDPCGRFYIYGDAIYWNLCRSSLDYAIEGNESLSPPVILGKGHILSQNSDLDAGFRLGIGSTSFCGLTYALRYTYFQKSLNDSPCFSKPIAAGATRLPAVTTAEDFNPYLVTSIAARYNLKLRYLDAESGFWKQMHCNLSVHPFVAIRLAWIDQTLDYLYQNGQAKSQRCDSTLFAEAYGALGGFDFNYSFCKRVTIIGRLSAGPLFSETDFTTVVTEGLCTSPSPTILLDTFEQDYCHPVFTTTASIGIEVALFTACCTTFDASFGYELHTWSQLQDFYDFPSHSAQAKLMRDNNTFLLHGCYASLRASF
jgi:hypothetical protein